jgi:hypothetical protein
MQPKDAIRQVIEFGHLVTRMYVEDLDDSDLFVRSVPGTNHIAWQLGHLAAGTHQMLSELGHRPPDLPAGLAEAHTKDTAASDDPAGFTTKAKYLELAEAMKEASMKAVDATPESSLDAPGPESMREYAPTVGSVLMLLGNHWLMHAGQFIPIRRKIGKPPLF